MPDSTFTPWFQQWYESELQRDLVYQGMTWIQKLIYRCLCQRMFVCETQPYAPDDDNLLWVLSGAENKQMWLDNKDAILVRFERIEIDGKVLLKHKRVEEDWNDVQERRESLRKIRSIAGKRGNAKRWGDRKIANSSQTVANGRKNYASVSDSASASVSGSRSASISTSKSECVTDASLKPELQESKPEPNPKTENRGGDPHTPQPVSRTLAAESQVPDTRHWSELTKDEKNGVYKLCQQICGDESLDDAHKPECPYLTYNKRARPVALEKTPPTPAAAGGGDELENHIRELQTPARPPEDELDRYIRRLQTPRRKVKSKKSLMFDDGIRYPEDWDLLSAAEKRKLISQHKVKQ